MEGGVNSIRVEAFEGGLPGGGKVGLLQGQQHDACRPSDLPSSGLQSCNFEVRC